MSAKVVHPDQLPKLVDQLPDFLDELRTHGYRIGVQEYVTAKSLLFKLHALGSFPATVSEISDWLSPLFSTTPEEQRTFSSQFEKWTARLFPASAPVIIEKPLIPAEETPSVAGDTPKPSRRFAGLKASREHIALIAIAVTVIGVMLFVKPNPDPIDPNLNGNGNVNSNGNGNANTNSNPNTNVDDPDRPPPTPVPTLTPRQQPIIDATQVGYASIIPPPAGPWTPAIPSEEAWYGKNFFLILGGASSLPLAFFLAWWGWNIYQRRLQLQRWNSIQKPRLDRIPVEGIRNKIFHGGTFRRLARELRRHRRLHSNRLDIRSTVGATSRRGLFTPVYGNRRALPEYLVLIDRVGYRDQQANYDSEIVNRLVENDVFIDRYFFQSDPNWCRQGGPESPQRSLQDLAGRHPDHHLIIFSDGEGLINPLTGQPHEWLKSLSQWRARSLITPLPVLDWSYREWVLGRSDFTVVPAGLKGMQHLVESIGAGGLLKRPALDDSRPYPALLEQKPEIWSQRDEPAQVKKLCAQLKRFLDEHGYYLLCACSVYPSLQWELTLYLAFQLMTRGQIDQCLASLVRLPWLRHGFMPEWLRKRLIADLGSDRERIVRRSLQHLLLTHLRNPQKAVPLTYASKTSRPDREPGLIDKLQERLSDWWKWRQLRRYIKPAPDRNLLHDEVFLNFMSRSKLALVVPNLLRHYFLRGGRLQLGMRSLPGFSLALLATGIVLTLLLLARPVEGIPPMNPTPADVAAFKLVYSPIMALDGTDVPMVVTNSILNTYDFSGMTLLAPDGSDVAIDGQKPAREQLEATVHVAKDAKPQQVELTLRDAGGNAFARLPFEIGKVGPSTETDNRRQLVIRFVNNQALPLADNFVFLLSQVRVGRPIDIPFVGNTLQSVTGGLVEPGVYRLTVPSNLEIFVAPAESSASGSRTVVFSVPPGSGPFLQTLYLRSLVYCRGAPNLVLSGPSQITEGSSTKVNASLPGVDPSIVAKEAFAWEAKDDLGRTPTRDFVVSNATVSVETSGMANRTITVTASIDLTSLGWRGCVRQTSMKIFVVDPNPPPPATSTPTPQRVESIATPTPTPPRREIPHGAIRTNAITTSAAKSLLKALGYYKGEINEDDSPEFREAIQKFQISADIPADGILGLSTLSLLRQESDRKPDRAADRAGVQRVTAFVIRRGRSFTFWTMSSNSTWSSESTETGAEVVDVIGPITVGGTSGLLLRNRKTPGVEYFLPNSASQSGVWLFRTRVNGRKWNSGDQMRSMRFQSMEG